MSDPVASNPAEWGLSVEEARDMLRQRMCPVCGTGPWRSPLNHVARRHGIDCFTMRDICGLTTIDKVTEPDLSRRFADHARSRGAVEAAQRVSRKQRGRQRWTSAGLQQQRETLARWEEEKPEAAHAARIAAARANKSPEALRKHSGTFRAGANAL